MYYLKRHWIMALFTTILGFLIVFDEVVVSTHALALLVLAFSLVLWYDLFYSYIQIRHAQKEELLYKVNSSEKIYAEKEYARIMDDMTAAYPPETNEKSDDWDGK